MRKGNIGVAPEGLPFLFLLALTALAFAALRFWPLALVFLVLTWFSGHFFRDPERVVPSEDDIAVSPADGRVIRVEPKADPITGEVRPCISIFMNVFNVHVNRSPVAGRVEAIRYSPASSSTPRSTRRPRTTNAARTLCATTAGGHGLWCRWRGSSPGGSSAAWKRATPSPAANATA